MKKFETAQEKYEFAINVLQRKVREYDEAKECIEAIECAYGFEDELPVILKESLTDLAIDYTDKQNALEYVSTSLKAMVENDNDFETSADILYNESDFDVDEDEDETDEIPNADGTYPSDFDDETEC